MASSCFSSKGVWVRLAVHYSLFNMFMIPMIRYCILYDQDSDDIQHS